MFLSGYSYKLMYQDGLGRLSLPTEVKNVPVPGNIMLVMDHLDNTLVKVKDIDQWTSQDLILSALRHQVMSGWPNPDNCVDNRKMLARSYFWWPGLDADIEQKVKNCESCQHNAKAPSAAPLHPWEWPSRPWSCLHINYTGPFEGHMFLVVDDTVSGSKCSRQVPILLQ